MRLSIDEPANSLQQITVENIELDEVDILKTIIELLDLQHDHVQIYKYYAHDLKELLLFDKHRKE